MAYLGNLDVSLREENARLASWLRTHKDAILHALDVARFPATVIRRARISLRASRGIRTGGVWAGSSGPSTSILSG